VVLAIALAVVITVLVTRPSGGGSDGNGPTAQNGNSDFASANDTGPVNIITEDPTCAAWGKISRNLRDREDSVRWGERDFSISATNWTPEQRKMYETVSDAMSQAAGQSLILMKQTPHRAMRELYGQLIAYANLFGSRLTSYVAKDDNLAVQVDTLASTLSAVCDAVGYEAATAIAPLVSNEEPPTRPVKIPEDSEPAIFLTAPAPSSCGEWRSLITRYSDETAAWRAIDLNLKAAQWTPEQRAVVDGVMPAMEANADELERVGRQSGNPLFEDFAVLAAQYRRSFVKALPSYSTADSYLGASATQLVRTIDWACKAAG
jgi:hypothetical protein